MLKVKEGKSGVYMNNIKEIIRRINLELANPSNDIKVMTLVTPTSAVPQKTLVANLGIMYSRANEKVVIIDTDFQNQSMIDAFGIEPKFGLSEFLDNKSLKKEQVISHVEGQSLDVISSGNVEKKDTKYLIGDPRFNALIDVLVGEYDRIIINTPLFKEMDSVNNIIHVSDGVVLIVEDNKVKKNHFYGIIRSLKHNKANILGYIMVEKD